MNVFVWPAHSERSTSPLSFYFLALFGFAIAVGTAHEEIIADSESTGFRVVCPRGEQMDPLRTIQLLEGTLVLLLMMWVVSHAIRGV